MQRFFGVYILPLAVTGIAINLIGKTSLAPAAQKELSWVAIALGAVWFIVAAVAIRKR